MKAKTYAEHKILRAIAGVEPITEQEWNAQNIPQPEPVMVRCACGHTVLEILVMSTTRGSSCSDCYDRMEE